MGGENEIGRPDYFGLKNFMEDEEADFLMNKTELLKAFFDFLEQERLKFKKERPSDLQGSLLILLLCVGTLVILFAVFFFWRSRYGVGIPLWDHFGGHITNLCHLVKNLLLRRTELTLGNNKKRKVCLMEFITVDGEMGTLDRIHDLGLLILLIVCKNR